MKTTLFKRLMVLFCAGALLGLVTAGCKHTANGAGQDMERMGQKIQDKTQ